MIAELFTHIPSEYIPQISDFIKVILPSIATYIVTRYSLSNPKRVNIMQNQFDLVYLPLYKLTLQIKPIRTSSKEQVLKYSKRIYKILQENYEYVFPQLHNLNSCLIHQLQSNEDYNNTLADIVYQIEFDYEYLKRQLGYPAKNIFQLYKRCKTKDKFQFFLLLVIIIDTVFVMNGLMMALSGDNFSVLFLSVSVFAIFSLLIRKI